MGSSWGDGSGSERWFTLQGTDISHLWKRKIIDSQNCWLSGDMLLSGRVDVFSFMWEGCKVSTGSLYQ